MVFSSKWILLFATVASLTSTGTTQICTPALGDRGHTYVVSTQDELDLIADHCTTVNGSVVLFANYTGGFHLPNVRNITGGLAWRAWYADPYTPEQPSPTTVDLPDLEYVGESMSMHSLSTLTKLSAPKLRTVGWTVDVEYAAEVDLRALESAENFRYMGNVSTLRVDSLREVHQRLFICNKDGCLRGVTPDTAFDLALPSLSVAGEIDIDGRYSSLAMPQLSNISAPASTSGYSIVANGRFRFGTSGGEVLNLTFPKLSYVSGGMWVDGGIGSFEMAGMRNLTSALSLASSTPLNVTLPFRKATYIDILGSITEARFPNLESWESLTVYSRLKLDCGITGDSLANTTAYPYNCYYIEGDSPSGGLSVSAKAGIGIGAGIGGLLSIGLLVWLIDKRKKRTEGLKSESNIHLEETPPTYGEVRRQDNPPEYASTRSGD
ncbi:hypothetical protein BJX63DRAFT_397056 [Aspergillus granulosus]|uniref:Peptidase A1 domain-containing protein n=1 Tax=Aspergillus granulosus TaxID=176169 RepID=A0ABR4HA76_9EURO